MANPQPPSDVHLSVWVPFYLQTWFNRQAVLPLWGLVFCWGRDSIGFFTVTGQITRLDKGSRTSSAIDLTQISDYSRLHSLVLACLGTSSKDLPSVGQVMPSL